MATKWQQPAPGLVERSEATWPGLWSILNAAGHAAMTLGLGAPLGNGVGPGVRRGQRRGGRRKPG